MKLKEVQLIYYLLKSILKDKNNDFKPSFELVVNYNNKIISADFLPISEENNRPTQYILEADMSYYEECLETNFFLDVLADFRREYRNFLATDSNPFEHPIELLLLIKGFINDSFNDNIPNFPKKVYNLKYLESDIIFKEAILEDNTYEIITLNVKPNAQFIKF